MLGFAVRTVPLTAFVPGIGKSATQRSALKLYRDAVGAGVKAKRNYARGSSFGIRRSVGVGVGAKTGTLRERLLGPTTGKRKFTRQCWLN